VRAQQLRGGAPRTPDLTTTIRNSGDHFTCIHSGQKITEFIYKTLISTGLLENDVNFETIINVIEELIVHYSYFDRKGELPSLNRAFFSSKFENEILNFSVDGKKRHTYKLNIPNGETYNLANPSLNNESPEEFFFQHLLNVLIGNINADVIPYAYHSNTHSAILKPENHTLNSSFQNWIGKLSSSSICRMYTLNYDTSIKAALTNNPNVKIHLINPVYCEKNDKRGYEILVDRLINIIPEFLNGERTQPVYSNDKHWHIFLRKANC
jgi:hypothetical protein